MKNILSLFLSIIMICSLTACGGNDDPEPVIPDGDNTEVPENSKILVTYFSWGGTTRRMAQQIVDQTGGTLFEIVPVNPYPTEYTPCTEVALQERDTDARPAIKNSIENMDSFDIIFIGCPVWWHTAPMIISTFTESYNLKGKIVVPFCTYASTYRDETLQKIVSLTPESTHLAGLGLTGSSVGNTTNITTWLKNIKVIKD